MHVFLAQANAFYRQIARPHQAQFLDRVTFDTTDFALDGIQDGMRKWRNFEDDYIVLEYSPNGRPVSADPADIDRTRAVFRSLAAEAGGALIEAETVTVSKCRAARIIQKSPQNPGMKYYGRLILPFRDFAYCIHVTSLESGMTGVRDTAIFAKLMQAGEITLDNSGNQTGWMADPYETSIALPLQRNRSEDAIYDADFPSHPLSRLRRLLHRIENSMQLARVVSTAAAS